MTDDDDDDDDDVDDVVDVVDDDGAAFFPIRSETVGSHDRARLAT